MLRTKKSNSSQKLIIDLDGPDGNAFVLLGYAKRLANSMGLSPEETSKILNEMKSGTYIVLLSVFERYFGEFVILESKTEHKLLNTEELEIAASLERIGYKNDSRIVTC